MNKRAVVAQAQQVSPPMMRVLAGQLVIPIVAVVGAARRGLSSFVFQFGLMAMQELFAKEAEAIAGRKGSHNANRTHNHWGTARTSLPFGGRNVVVDRPRVRQRKGREVQLSSVEEFRASDAMPAHVAEKVVLGVSTRGYDRSLDELPDEVETRGTSKSAASRALIEGTTEKLTAFLGRRLDDLGVVAMFIDGIEVAGQSAVIALGVTRDGKKEPLGVWTGSTENHVVATALLQDLIARGLRATGAMLFVIDGGKGIAKAIRDVFGRRAIIQRCQVHKMRNVRDHLPQSRRPQVMRQMREAYKSRSAKTAKQQLLQLARWLEANGEDDAAASLREGLDETLTVLRLALSKTLCRTFATSNAIENMNGTVRRVCRNVKRWQGDSMIKRWVALGVAEAERKFRRVKGHAEMKTLVDALARTTGVTETVKAA